MINPLLLSKGLKVKKFLEENKMKILSEYIDIIPSKDNTGFIVVFEYKFATKPEAQCFKDMYDLAEKVGF